jgi:hypothetical protein
MKVPDPVHGADGYFVLPRRCRACAGNNVVEIDGALSIVRQQRRARRHAAASSEAAQTKRGAQHKPLAV